VKKPRGKIEARLERRSGASLGGGNSSSMPEAGAVLDCGWGRLIFAHTFASPDAVAEELSREGAGRRDIAFYVADPHVVLSRAPVDLFLDPSDTYRLWLSDYRAGKRRHGGFFITPANLPDDIDDINRIYLARRMMPLDPETLARARARRRVILVARNAVIGVVMGVDHVTTFEDPENGSSLWSLAVDPQSRHPGIGEALSRRLAERFKARGRAFMDLSVLHDNKDAIALYKKLGFQRVTTFAIKNRNPINERLFTGPDPEGALNPYAAIIVDEARRRGIGVELNDAARGFFTLEFGGRSVRCRESLSDLTSAVAMSLCDDKAATRRVLSDAGIKVPAQAVAGEDAAADADFLARHRAVVVKPARGEQGRGISVGLTKRAELPAAIEAARRVCDTVLIEQFVPGADIRVVIIGDEVVAAAERRPPEITGNGTDSIAQLVESLSRRRAAATRGESRIPLDDATRACIAAQGHDLDEVLEYGAKLMVRRTANLHTGGTITDITGRLNPVLAEAALNAARAIQIPVAGIDMLAPAIDGEDYVIIEVNERPGLANHEPRPTAERFIDLLFPQSVSRLSPTRHQNRSARP
jgi:GNAT-family acetyltransferase (TIGR03103 family)